jgi:hypothetical protein
MTISKFAALCALCALLSLSAFAQLTVAPQGRLTLTSGTPVMTSDVVGASTIYYTPYVGSNIPIYTSGTGWAEKTFSQLTLALNSTEETGAAVYDIFAFLNSGVVTIGVNCYSWGAPSTISLASRGTGSVVQIQQLNGIWVNTNGSFCLYNGTTQYNTIAANSATYLGSVYVPSAGGETTVNIKPTAASGGSDNVIGIWNAYNRVKFTSLCTDSNSSWNYSTNATWRAADGGGTNYRISWLDGLQQTFVKARYQVLFEQSQNAAAALVGVDLNSTSATPNLQGGATQPTAASFNAQVEAEESFGPQLGFNYVQAMEAFDQTVNGTTITFFGSPYGSLSLDTEF